VLTTSLSLLGRLGQPNQNEAWERFVLLYTPFLSHILTNRLQIRPQEVVDLVQEIFISLLRTLPNFKYDPAKGNFRGYLRQICTSKAIDLRRKHRFPTATEAELSAEEDEKAGAEIAQVWEKDHNRFLTCRALELMKTEFQPSTWKACWEFVVNGRPATEIARDLGITENAVFVAKHRVIKRLRQELEGLLEE
jgi:RNA polymerase sigma-70 factor (ECF subfamily)